MITVKAVIFDYGNVLCEPQRESDLSLMASAFGMERVQLEPLYWRYRDHYDQGECDAHTYWKKIGGSSIAAGTVTAAQLEQAIRFDNQSWTRPNPPVLHWVEKLQTHGIKTAILSNMPLPLRQYIDSECHWLPRFDHKVFSCDAGSIKPDTKIYRYCLERLSLEPEETLFIDDRVPNIDAARKLGMHGLVFSDMQKLVAEVSSRFHLPAPLYEPAGRDGL